MGTLQEVRTCWGVHVSFTFSAFVSKAGRKGAIIITIHFIQILKRECGEHSGPWLFSGCC